MGERMSDRQQTTWHEHGAIGLVLLMFLVLGALYGAINPLFESPDEVWHYEYVRWLAEGHGLPVSDLISEQPWHQEGSQPPLYYLMAAALTAPIDTRDAPQVIRYNPHAAIGQAEAFGNRNVMAHTDRETFPWRGTVLAAHLARLFSTLLSAATVFCTYLLARTILPGAPDLAAAASAIVAFNPQFLFISASVNNDNLAILAAAVTLLLSVRLLMAGGRSPDNTRASWSWRWSLALGLVLGVAALSKLSGLVFLPLAALALLPVAWRRRDPAWLIRQGAVVTVMALLVAGWWYLRNWLLYRDPFGLAVMFAVLPARAQGPSLQELIARAQGVWRSSWAVFGWFNVLVPGWVYGLYDALALLGALGLVIAAIQRRRVYQRSQWLALGYLLLWCLAVLAALIAWSQKRYPQGRLLFPALPAAATLLALGLSQWTPRRWRSSVLAGIAGLMCLLALLIPFRWIAPVYAGPELLPATATLPNPLDVDFGGRIRLRGFEILNWDGNISLRPGDALDLRFYWQADVPLTTDYSVYLHLLDENGIIVAQRDSYPAGGNFITSRWTPDVVIPDMHRLRIPLTAPTPCDCRLVVGLYDYKTGARLPVSGPNATRASDGWVLLNVSLEPRVSERGVPNPLEINFEGKLALVGFDLDRRMLRPGESLRLRLYWEAQQPLEVDYVAFAHLLLPPDAVWAGQDRPLQLDGAGSSAWPVGRVVRNRYDLRLPPNAPPGDYIVEVGIYEPESFTRLKVGQSDAGIVLGTVRVLPPET
ncbi:MAG TPA: DUF2142 domain-containing protein [Anaerolineae bacterium]|nr:DUF2142 domain-containing protein [Anaerolineae bacterium]